MDFSEFCDKYDVTEEEREPLFTYYTVMKYGNIFTLWMRQHIEHSSGKQVILKKKRYAKKDERTETG